jgi:protein-tyrosine sulfotransferase
MKCNDKLTRQPIFILGVPRSGTTLLRTILDSHPAIACGPETPWLAAHQPSSIMALHRYLTENPLGYCRSFGVSQEVVTEASRDFAMALMDAYARSKGKQRWAEKTPDNLMYLDFFVEMFPDAFYVCIVRDALDTAISTSIIPPHRRGISDWHEKFLLIGPECKLENNCFNALLRWNHWNRKADEVLAGRRLLHVSYEDLVCNPRSVLQSVFDFVQASYDENVLDYARFKHDLPDWEWGSADVKHFNRITPERTRRADKELTAVEREVLMPLALYGRAKGECFTGEARVEMASTKELQSEKFKLLGQYCDSFARPLGLAPLQEQEKWEYPWLWLRAFQHIDWRGKDVVFFGGDASSMPWMLSLFGANVTIHGASTEQTPGNEELRRKLQAPLHFRFAEPGSIQLADECADFLIWTSSASRFFDKGKVAKEAARVLKRSGVLAMTFQFSDESSALKYFEELFRSNPTFGNITVPKWQPDSFGMAGAVLQKS